MIEIKNLSIELPLSISKRIKIIENLSLCIASGEIFGILGQNGSGKSVFIKTLAGIILPINGNVVFHDSAVGSSQVIYLPQETHCLTVGSDMPEKPSQREKEGLNQHAWLADCQRWTKKGNETHSTSNGERQMIAIAQALLANPGFLLLDEPFMPLDTTNRKQVIQWLTTFAQNGAVIVVASSHPEWLETLCHQIGILTPGRFTLTKTKEKQGQEPSNEYHIRIATTLDETRAAWFEGLQIQNDGNQASLIGKLEDQAALFGVLGKIRDMGIELISVNRIRFSPNTGQDKQLHYPYSRRGGE